MFYLDYLKTQLRHMINWLRIGSLWPLSFGLACCAIEMLQSVCSRYDIERFGCLFRGTPRQAELLLVAGTVTTKMAPGMKKLQELMAKPAYTVAMGSCAGGGGYYYYSYSIVRGVDRILPVDSYIGGCPPSAEGLLYGIIVLQKKICPWYEPKVSSWWI